MYNLDTVNLRAFYDLRLTNEWTEGKANWDGCRCFRGTPRQVLAEIVDFRCISGGCHIAYEITRCGSRYDAEDLRLAVMEQEIKI